MTKKKRFGKMDEKSKKKTKQIHTGAQVKKKNTNKKQKAKQTVKPKKKKKK